MLIVVSLYRGILNLLCFWIGLLMAASFKVCPLIMSTLFVSTSPSRLFFFFVTFPLNFLLFVITFRTPRDSFCVLNCHFLSFNVTLNVLLLQFYVTFMRNDND